MPDECLSRALSDRCATLHFKGPIPHEFREAMGNRIYGCDDCLAACPWNKFAREASEAKLVAREDLKEPAIADLLTLDDAAFRSLFSGSPVKRIGRNRFIRNVLIAAGNSAEPSLVPQVDALLVDDAPEVRGAAVWALSRLVTRAGLATSLQGRVETDPDVESEIALALSGTGKSD
jgi:epoxyqueuosine reductase